MGRPDQHKQNSRDPHFTSHTSVPRKRDVNRKSMLINWNFPKCTSLKGLKFTLTRAPSVTLMKYQRLCPSNRLAACYSQTLSLEPLGTFPLGPHLCMFSARDTSVPPRIRPWMSLDTCAWARPCWGANLCAPRRAMPLQ